MQTDTPLHHPRDLVISRMAESDLGAADALYRLALGSAESRLVELRRYLALPLAGAPTVIAPSANSDAQELLTRCGFAFVRSTRHMRRGTLPRPRRRSRIYGQESFAIG
jgi:hypothetical protein